MTIHAYYDLDGTIQGFVVFDGPSGTGMMLAPGPGVLVAEVKGLTLKKGEPDVERLSEIAAREKITTPMPQWTYKSKRGRH